MFHLEGEFDLNRCCFIVCWFGKLPDYFDVWMKTCEYNSSFDYTVFTDAREPSFHPSNVYFKNLTLTEFVQKAQMVIGGPISVKRPYRICDFRPMFGKIFENELEGYDFWGFCDVDVVFGDLKKFITDEILNSYDAIFNGGHLSLLRNIDKINTLYISSGGTFNYKSVVRHDAIFAFDEITGIQQIAKKNGVKALYYIPYIETEIKYKQLRSRLEISNPQYQAYYWKKGNLYRLKYENNFVYRQCFAYMHLQKRKLCIDETYGKIGDSFWVTPAGFCAMQSNCRISKQLINKVNPYEGKEELQKQARAYKLKKVREILTRTPYQIYVRLCQEKNGINKNEGTIEERQWEKY